MPRKLVNISIIILAFVFVIQAFSQNGENKTIKRIVVVGNDKTREKVIQRELTSKVGETLNPDKLTVDKNRLMNLNLFTRIEFQQMEMDDGVLLLVMVSERWYIFPYPILFINERDWGKVSYGAGLIDQNFRGANVELDGALWLGYNPGIDLRYSNPWIGRKHRFYTKINFFSSKERSKSLQYEERFEESILGGTFTFGKKWGYKTFLALSTGYQELTVPDKYRDATVSKTGTDQLPSVGLSFRYDSRDLYHYPRKGIRFDLYSVKTGFSNTIDYYKHGVDFRFYLPIYKKLIFAGRTSADYSDGIVPVYGKTYLGYSERIRGYFSTRQEGDNRTVLGAEIRFPILPIRYFNVGDQKSAMGGYGSNLPFGISGALFYDAGATWDQGETLHQEDFLKGFGAGLHIHLPYVHVLRFEYAFNAAGDSEFIFDMGVYF